MKYELRHNATLTKGKVLDVYQKGKLKGVVIIDDLPDLEEFTLEVK